MRASKGGPQAGRLPTLRDAALRAAPQGEVGFCFVVPLMRNPARILIVDDVADNVEILRMRLSSLGYEVVVAEDGEQALARVRDDLPDLVLLDIMMPKIDGLEVVRRMKADTSLPFIPVILVTAKATPKDVVAGLDAGGDDYLTKPIEHGALVARVRAMLRIKALHDEVQALNKDLEAKVQAQVGELERVGRLRRFLAPQLAQAIVSAGDENILGNHRREIVAMFCDLRGFTAFSETSEPEDIMQLLAEYHGALGPLIRQYEGTLDRFTGDGMMVFFNDPLPCPDAPERATRLALEMRDAVARLGETWRKRGHRLGFGVGMAQGYATLGRIGFEDRFDYTAIGAVINLAARLCAEAEDGQVLVSGRLAAAAETVAEVEELGERQLKGMARPLVVTCLRTLKT
ncbi:hypothetical protein RSO01_51240 [Reyranella soli]|uniref:Adenylate/guanylate cyclase domain-containing response regulator n=2 Tax=Reyranella soli TaxID=1230389 RepID=A0A512NG85_9HYPH|nr:hypothetical protein RSO01_51240 [Reyranella soli]